MPDYSDNDYPSEREPEQPPDYPDHMSRRERYGMDGGRGVARKNEIIVGRKRFKLYEKKRLNFKKAKEFCQKKDGKLAEGKLFVDLSILSYQLM